MVPTDVLATASRALRSGRGEVLQDVLRETELEAIGHDGMAGDDVEKGGGHYREVTKVRAFLEGYRQAEVRRIARETTTMLLDKVASEGIQGLDLMLASMTKASDDTGEAGELNDSLVDFLNDAIRQQDKKVSDLKKTERNALVAVPEVDLTASVWNITEENGEIVEILNPNDPETKKIMEKEFARSEASSSREKRQVPDDASEKLLLLLKLLRDRIKAEASFANDEKGRNLRVLAYCLNLDSDSQRKQLVQQEMKNTINVSTHLPLQCAQLLYDN
jgi:hypothetical protein